jgi:PTH1 family peptidyl-tRNA hydrolase
MKIIVGLGNPGKKYEETRHNVGFLALEALTKFLISNCQFLNKFQISNFKFQNKFKAEIVKLDARRCFLKTDLVLVKPQTLMNSSGLAVKKILQHYNKTIKTSRTLKHYRNLYVIHDDLDIKLGEYKLQFGKGPKEHGGINSIERELGTKNFWRVRIGLENRVLENKSFRILGQDYVLDKFSKKEKEIIHHLMEIICRELAEKLL